jgi:hypothetical protein
MVVGELKTMGAEFFSAVDITQLTASQQRALIASLNASADLSTPQASASAIVQASTALPPLSTREEQEDILGPLKGDRLLRRVIG